jgi:hypothetical protein
LNSEFQVILPCQAMAREYAERVASAVPSFNPTVSPASMWLRRRLTPHEDGLATLAELHKGE